MQFVDARHLLGYLLGVFVRFFDGPDVDGDGRLLLQVLPQLQVQNLGVGRVYLRFVDHGQPQLLFVAIRSVGFEEIFYLAHRGDLVGHERFEFGVEIHNLGFVHHDLLEEVFDVLGHLQVFVFSGVVLAGHVEILRFSFAFAFAVHAFFHSINVFASKSVFHVGIHILLVHHLLAVSVFLFLLLLFVGGDRVVPAFNVHGEVEGLVFDFLGAFLLLVLFVLVLFVFIVLFFILLFFIILFFAIV